MFPAGVQKSNFSSYVCPRYRDRAPHLNVPSKGGS